MVERAELILVSGWPVGGAAAIRKNGRAAKVVAATEALAGRLTAAGIEARSLDTYGDRTAIVGAEAEIWSVVRNWHRDPDIARAMGYGPHQPAELCELYLGSYLKWIYTRTRQLAACLEVERPQRIRIIERSSATRGFFPESDEPCFEKALRVLGVDRTRVLPLEDAEMKNGAVGAVAVEWAKQRARRVIEAAQKFGGPAVPCGKGPCVVLAGAPQHVESVARALAGRARLIHLDEAFRAAKLDFVKKYGMRYVSYPDLEKYFFPAAAQDLDAYRMRLREAADAVKRRIAAAGLLKTAGLDLASAAEDRIDWLLREAAPEAARWSETLGRWLEREGVDAVVVDEDTVTFRKTLVREASRRGIATLQVPHGVNLAGFHYDLFPVSSEQVAVGGDGIARFYESNGVAAEKIRVTGVPRYDTLSFEKKEGNRARIRKKLGLSESDRLILFGSTTLFDLNTERSFAERRQATEDLAAALRTRPEARLGVRLHPLDLNPEATLGPLERAGVRIAEKRAAGNASAWIEAADVVVSFSSNLVFEAIVLEKPVIVLDYFKTYADHIPYFSGEGRWLKAQNRAEIEALLAVFLGPQKTWRQRLDHARQWLLDHWVGPLDGRSGARVADAVLESVREKAVVE